MIWWITSMDGEISFTTKSASSAAAACTQLAAKYGMGSFEAFCEAADYSPDSFRIAGVIVEPRPSDPGVQIAGPPQGLVERAFLAVRGAMRR